MDEEIEKRKKNILNKFKKTFFSWVTDNYDKVFLVVLAIALIIRFWVFSRTFDQPIWWDTGDYLSAAKRWAGVNPFLIDTWYYRRGPLWTFLCSLFFRSNLGETGIRVFLALLSTGAVASSYFLIKNMFNKKLALWVSIAMTASWIYLFFTGRPMTNIPAAFFVITALLFFWKGYVLKQGNKFIYLFGGFFALACMTRMQYLALAIPILIFILCKDRLKFIKEKSLWIAAGIFLLLFIPQIIIHWQHFGNPFLDLAQYYLGIKGISQTGEVGVQLASLSDLFVYFNNLPYILDGNQNGYSNLFTLSPMYLSFVLGIFLFFTNLVLGIDKITKDKDIQARFFVLISILFGFLFLGYIAPQLEQRYVLDLLPFVFVIAVFPLNLVDKFLEKKTSFKPIIRIILICLFLTLLLIPNFFVGTQLIESKKTSYLEVKLAGEWLKENSNPEDIIIGGSTPQLTYYSERSVYPYDLKTRRELPSQNESGLDEFILEFKPRFFTASVFESEEDWVFSYPQRHADILKPVKTFYHEEQLAFVIYEFNYS